MILSEAIGGYFGLELNSGKSFHDKLIALNTGRNSFEYILTARKVKHIYIPYYTCDVLLEPIKKLNISYNFYSIDEKLEPKTLNGIKSGSAFMYTNYFGLKTEYVKKITRLIPNVIIDASQSFFQIPILGIDTFYSPRKFFGVPDGGYVSCDSELKEDLEVDHSSGRMAHLVTRIDKSAEEAYSDFKINDGSLSNQPIKKMSKLTQALLSGINYESCRTQRNNNFNYLHKHLRAHNCFQWIEEELVNGPMVYPFYSLDIRLRDKLISNKIYIASYWPKLAGGVEKGSFESNLVKNLYALPLDQRYGEQEMKKIIKLISE